MQTQHDYRMHTNCRHNLLSHMPVHQLHYQHSHLSSLPHCINPDEKLKISSTNPFHHRLFPPVGLISQILWSFFGLILLIGFSFSFWHFSLLFLTSRVRLSWFCSSSEHPWNPCIFITIHYHVTKWTDCIDGRRQQRRRDRDTDEWPSVTTEYWQSDSSTGRQSYQHADPQATLQSATTDTPCTHCFMLLL